MRAAIILGLRFSVKIEERNRERTNIATRVVGEAVVRKRGGAGRPSRGRGGDWCWARPSGVASSLVLETGESAQTLDKYPCHTRGPWEHAEEQAHLLRYCTSHRRHSTSCGGLHRGKWYCKHACWKKKERNAWLTVNFERLAGQELFRLRLFERGSSDNNLVQSDLARKNKMEASARRQRSPRRYGGDARRVPRHRSAAH